MTLPLGSSSGPPLLPGLIAVSVWMRLLSWPALDRDAPTDGRDDPAGDRVGERAERAADRDRRLADLDGRRVADRGGRQAGRLDLDDGEVGQGVDAVDRSRRTQRPSLRWTVRLDGSPSTTWWLVRMRPFASKIDAGAGCRCPWARLGDDRDDGRADGLGDVDDRALAAGRGRVGDGRVDDRVRDPRLVGAGGADGEVRPAGRQDGGADDGGEDEARADGALGARAGVGGRRRGRRPRAGPGSGSRWGWRASRTARSRSRWGSTRPVVMWAGSCRASRPSRPARRGCRRSSIGSSAAPVQSPDAVAGRSYRLECGRAP